MNFEFLAGADAEMNAAAEWYELSEDGLGTKFLHEISSATKLIGIYRRVGRPLDALPDEYREFPLNRFPFRLIYRVRGPEILIVAVAHDSRRPRYWRDRVQEDPAAYRLAA